MIGPIRSIIPTYIKDIPTKKSLTPLDKNSDMKASRCPISQLPNMIKENIPAKFIIAVPPPPDENSNNRITTLKVTDNAPNNEVNLASRFLTINHINNRSTLYKIKEWNMEN